MSKTLMNIGSGISKVTYKDIFNKAKSIQLEQNFLATKLYKKTNKK